MADDLVTRIPDDIPDADILRAWLRELAAKNARRYLPALGPAREDALGSEWVRCEKILIEVQAHTPHGVRAKLDYVQDLLESGGGGNELEILRSAIADLETLGLQWDALHRDKPEVRTDG